MSPSNTLLAGGLSAAPLIGYEKIMTVEAFNEYVIFGATVGFWLAALGGVSLLLITMLNAVKLYKELRGKK